jgi:hypothetical protein
MGHILTVCLLSRCWEMRCSNVLSLFEPRIILVSGKSYSVRYKDVSFVNCYYSNREVHVFLQETPAVTLRKIPPGFICLVWELFENRKWTISLHFKDSDGEISGDEDEDDCLLGCCAMLYGRNWLTFQRCLLPPSSGRDHPDDRGSKRLWNVCQFISD